MRPKFARQPGDDGVAPEEQAKAQHAVGRGEHDGVQRPQAHVDQRRGMEENAPGKDRAEETPHVDAPAARPTAADIIECREGQRAARAQARHRLTRG